MSFLNKILSALGIGHADASTQPSSEPSATSPAGSAAPTPGTATPATGTTAPASTQQVNDKLAALAKANPGLHPDVSIVDLLKALNLPSDFESRKQLAEEFKITDYEGSEKQNTQLHDKVLAKASQSGASV